MKQGNHDECFAFGWVFNISETGHADIGDHDDLSKTLPRVLACRSRLRIFENFEHQSGLRS